MKMLILIAVMAGLVTLSEQNRNYRVPAVYKINLDLDYEQRWAQIINDNKLLLKKQMQGIQKDLSLVKKMIVGAGGYVLQLLYKNKEFIKELRAVAKLADIQFQELLVLNFMYELFVRKACTTILYRNSDQQNNLARNLDYSVAEFMKPLVFSGHFYKNNKLIIKASILPGFLGFHTVNRIEGYALSINQRNKQVYTQTLKEILFRKSKTIPYEIMTASIKYSSFEEIVDHFRKVEIDAPVYFNVIGKDAGQAIVIARSYDRIVWEQSFQNNIMNNTECICQTNFDIDEHPVWDQRKQFCDQKTLQLKNDGKMQDNLVLDLLFNAPLFVERKNLTTLYTAMINTETSQQQEFIWE